MISTRSAYHVMSTSLVRVIGSAVIGHERPHEADLISGLRLIRNLRNQPMRLKFELKDDED